ncbi:MAG: class I SAM-dependent methyltransferase [Thioploca sp.]|nr:class I SAM-dependent methyltransferase [Thioploca sp.]
MKAHWEKIYQTLLPTEVSWYQERPDLSLRLINIAGITSQDSILDVGGGTSMLVDYLLDAGLTQLTVLDLSAAAIQQTQARLGDKGSQVQWIEADVTTFQPPQRYKLWHDRAVFHFLTAARDRTNYVQVLKAALLPESYVIIATFAADGPQKCSGLEVVRYDAPKIRAELGNEFELLEIQHESHATPKQAEQKFTYFLFKYLG